MVRDENRVVQIVIAFRFADGTYDVTSQHLDQNDQNVLPEYLLTAGTVERAVTAVQAAFDEE